MSQLSSQLRHGQPVWLHQIGRARPACTHPPLRARRTCDVAIVGGGITGAFVALTFATEGIPVIQLEGGGGGSGGTLASSALLLQEPDREP